MNFDVKTDSRVHLRDLKEGQLFVPTRHYDPLKDEYLPIRRVRRRSRSPFKSLTYYGTTVSTYPSDWVFPVEEVR